MIKGIVSLISAGTEMLVYRGELVSAEELALDRPGRAGMFPFPVKYGYQVVGRVVEAGAGSSLPVGQVVFAVHPHQSLFVLPCTRSDNDGIAWVYPVPAGLDLERAAFTNLLGVALNALLDAPIRIGDCVVVAGLGLVGLFLAYLARPNAERLILIDPSVDRRKAASRIGADAVVAPDEARGAVADYTAGRGADLSFEASGSPVALQAALANTGQDGSVVVVSYYGNRQVPLQLAPEFHYGRLLIMSSQAGRLSPVLTPRWDMRRRVAVSMNRLRQFPFDLVSHRFELRDAPLAYQLLDHPEGDVRGVLLRLNED